MVILATIATSLFVSILVKSKIDFDKIVIASQAIITGCFSLLSQAGSLGFCAPLRVYHTSDQMIGQIYVPVRYCFLLKSKMRKMNLIDNQLVIDVFNINSDNIFSKFISFNKCIWINCL